MCEKGQILESNFQIEEFSKELNEMIYNMKVNTADYSFPQVVDPGENISAMIQKSESLEIDPIIPDGYHEKSLDFQQKCLEVLQSINKNTANLYTIVELLHKDNEHQELLIELASEILTITKAKDKEEADSIYKNISKKVNDTVENIDSAITIMGWATNIYQIVVNMLQR